MHIETDESRDVAFEIVMVKTIFVCLMYLGCKFPSLLKYKYKSKFYDIDL